MATYFVSTSGNDNNSGSQGSPFATIAKALSVMVSADTLYLRQGTYNQDITTNVVNVPGGTSWFNPTTIASFPNENATLAPNNASSPAVIYIVSPYVILDRLILDASNTRYGWSTHVADHIRFQNGEIKFSGLNFPFHTPFDPGLDEAEGVEFGGSFNEILNTEIHHSPHSYGFYATGHDNLINNCNIHDNGGFAIQIFDGNFPNTQASSNIISNNTMYNNGFFRNYPAITVGEGSSNLVYNNVIYNNFGGIWVYKDGTNTNVVNNTLYNNTVLGIQIYNPNTNAVVRNNIIIGSNGPAVDDQGSGSIISNNTTVAQNFVNVNAGDFHLLSGSTAIDAGVTLSISSTDKDGISRPQGSNYDIGAYEFTIGIITITCDDTLPWALITSGVFANNSLLKTVNFSIRPARWICFRSISEVNGGPWTSCSELSVLVNGISLLPKSLWSIWCFDSEELIGEGSNNGHAIHCIDNNINTFWHTKYINGIPNYPHNIVIDLSTVYPLNGFTYLPRQDGQVNGTVASFEFYVSDYWIMPGRLMRSPMMQPLLAM